MTTINEKKAFKGIIIGWLISMASVIMLLTTMRDPSISYGMIGALGFFIGGIISNYNFYSLGWEYKRISMEGEQ